MGRDRIIPRDFRRELLMQLFDVSSKRCVLAYHEVEVDMSAAESICAQFHERGINLSHIHLLVKAAAIALNENPTFNSVITRSGIRQLEKASIGVIDDVPARLPLLLIKDAHLKPVETIARELEQSAKLLATNEPEFMRRLDFLRHLPPFLRRLMIRYLRSCPPRALSQLLPTFFVASLGSAYSGFPIYGTTAYLFAGGVVERPFLVAGEPAVRPIMCLTLVTDHRIIDGVAAATFLNRVKELIGEGG
jgi:pyruvate/2-oxoglutarate dehydrogenase complex dihydrolipoamide acyltransferase (E2) component